MITNPLCKNASSSAGLAPLRRFPHPLRKFQPFHRLPPPLPWLTVSHPGVTWRVPTQTARLYVLHLGVSTSGARRHWRLVGNCDYKSHVINTSAVNNSAQQQAHLLIILGTTFLPPKVMALQLLLPLRMHWRQPHLHLVQHHLHSEHWTHVQTLAQLADARYI